MSIRIGINGFGRIGRNAARIILHTEGLELAAINSLSDASSHAYLLKHDSSQGSFDMDVVVRDTSLVIAGSEVQAYREKLPSDIPWEDADAHVVLECTGKARTQEDAQVHLGRTVKKIVISAPVKDDTPTYVLGVNQHSYHGESIVSNSSCTTNCVSTVLKVLDAEFGVLRGSMTTVHAATDSQNLLDNSHSKETRLRRSSLVNVIPAASGSSNDVAKLFPHLKGLLPCRALRVPTPTVSLIDLVIEAKKQTDKESLIAAFTRASNGTMKGILAVASEELVSSDYIGSTYSSVVDPYLCDVVGKNLIHITAWYDNEWGYANRLVELASLVAQS